MQDYFDPSKSGAFGSVRSYAMAKKISQKEAKKRLQAIPTYTLHKPARKGYKTRPYRSSGIDHVWQADLADMQAYAKSNNGNNYILTVIDVFSHYAWAEPLKSKHGKEVKRAFEHIFALGRVPFKLHTDWR